MTIAYKQIYNFLLQPCYCKQSQNQSGGFVISSPFSVDLQDHRESVTI